MILFRKRKVQKLVEEYAAEYVREIPKDSIAYEELLQLKEIRLEEIAIAYDGLQGFKYYKGLCIPEGLSPNARSHIPDKSKYTPSIKQMEPATNTITGRLRRLDMLRAIKAAEFDTYNDIDYATQRYVPSSGLCWKAL